MQNFYHIAKNQIFSPLTFGEHLLHQAGRTHCKCGTVIPMHSQLDYFELTVATGGKGVVITNGESVPISPNDIYISFAGDFHSIISDKFEPLKYDFLTIQTTNTEIKQQMNSIVAKMQAANCRIIKNDLICELVTNIVYELNNETEYSDIIIETMITQIFIFLIRSFKSINESNFRRNISQSEKICLNVMNYINSHIYSIKNLSEVAKDTNYSYNYLSNLFKKTTNETLVSYYQNRRLSTALSLLKSRDFNITEISNMLGYSSIYSFSSTFKKKYGVSPSKYISDDNN